MKSGDFFPKFSFVSYLIWFALILTSCAGKEKLPEPVTEAPVVSSPRVIVRTVPERVSDLQIVTAIEDLFHLAGLEARSFTIESQNGKVLISGEAESSRELNSALALVRQLKGVKGIETSISSATVSGSTTAAEEGPGLVSWFVTLFWPILSLIGAAFIAIGFLYVQTRMIKKQLARRRELSTQV